MTDRLKSYLRNVPRETTVSLLKLRAKYHHYKKHGYPVELTDNLLTFFEIENHDAISKQYHITGIKQIILK